MMLFRNLGVISDGLHAFGEGVYAHVFYSSCCGTAADFSRELVHADGGRVLTCSKAQSRRVQMTVMQTICVIMHEKEHLYQSLLYCGR